MNPRSSQPNTRFNYTYGLQCIIIDTIQYYSTYKLSALPSYTVISDVSNIKTSTGADDINLNIIRFFLNLFANFFYFFIIMMNALYSSARYKECV